MTRPTQPEEPLAGRLHGIDVPTLIRDLGCRRATGELRFDLGPVSRTLFFADGRINFAASSDPNDRLGEHLLRRGRITLRQLETALLAQDSGKRLGTLMVEAGILTAVELRDAVVDQIRSIAFDLMTWTAGTYRFDETPPVDEDIPLDLTTVELLFHGIREVRSMSLIDRGVGTPRTVFRLTEAWEGQVKGFDLPEGARAIVDRLEEGPASVETLCREVGVANFEIFQTLWAYRLLGVAETCERPDESESEGNLGTTSFPELLISLEERGETGVLHLFRGRVERNVMFAAGRCVFATSNDSDDGLVDFLFRRGMISLRDKEETARRLLSNKRVGTILRELGAIDDVDLQLMVRQQVGEIVYDTFRWEDGEYAFVPGSLPHAEEITLHCPIGSIIAEGVRRIPSWTRLLRGCGGVDNPLCLTPRYLEILDTIGAGVAEWEVVNALKAPQTPRRVCALAELDDVRVCQILWTLKLLGAIEDSPIEVEDIAALELEAEEARVASPTGDGPSSPEPAAEPMEVLPNQAVETDPALGSLDEEPGEAETQRDIPLDLSTAALSPSEIDDAWPAEADAPESEEPLPEPELELPPDVDDVIERFNAMHRIVFLAVRSEVGAGATNFIRSSCARAAEKAPDPVEGVGLHPDGSWDVDGLKRVISAEGIDDPWVVYQGVLDEEFVALHPLLGSARADELKQKIWEIQQAPKPEES
jgi:hypothetical protein